MTDDGVGKASIWNVSYGGRVVIDGCARIATRASATRSCRVPETGDPGRSGRIKSNAK